MTDQMVFDAESNQWRKKAEQPAPPKPLTKCPKCGGQTVKYTQKAYGDQWDCTAPGCAYSHYYSLGD